VELLVGRCRGPDDVVVDPSVLDRLEDRVSRLAIAPVTPADEHRPLRVRVRLSHLSEERAVRHPVAREDECERLPGRLELRQRPAGRVGRIHADDAIVAGVPVEELAFDVAERDRVGIDGKDDRRAHSPVIVVGLRRRA